MERPEREEDWSDVHAGKVSSEITSARMAFETAFSRLPKWVDHALAARDAVVRRFGMKTVSEGALSMTTLPVLQENPEVYEVGLQDSHLTFTLQTELRDQHLSVTTRIWFNHWAGRLYLALVLIPHKRILRHAIRSLA